MNILVVGAGFSGAVVARELATIGCQVTIIDKRNHIAGNAYDYVNDFGIRIHKYGPHLFHTSNKEVVAWLSQFTEWIPYKHKVKAMLQDGRLVTLPVNKETANIVGHENILDIFYRPYSRKMWGIELDDLDHEIISRVKIRDDLNDLYFPGDSFQALPKNGYTDLIEKILDHKRIQINLNTTFKNGMENNFDYTFNSMPIDEYFNYKYGQLPYRSIKFHTSTIGVPKLFPVSVINFTHAEKYTRVTEWKNLPNSIFNSAFTTITVEEPCDYKENDLERYYPIKDKMGQNKETYKKYLSEVPNNMIFIGRCGLYAYLDMHQAINSALIFAKKFIAENL
jgi:UDP-galactopyranose mutase